MLPAFIIYLLVLLLIGWFAFQQRTDETSDYMLSKRGHGSWVSALSASASSESGWVMLGLTGMGYTTGISCFLILPTALAGYLFNWLVIGPRLHSLAATAHCSSIPDVFDAVFSNAHDRLRLAIRVVTVLIIVAFMGFYVAAQFTATGKALQATFGWDYQSGVIVGTVIVIFYTALGGMRAISWTDVLQASLMIVALVALPVLVVGMAGSDTDLFATLRSIDPNLLDIRGGTSGVAAIGFMIGFLSLGLGYPGQPHVLRRFLAARDENVFRQAPWIAICWSQIVFAGAITLGLAARVVFPDVADPEQALPVAAVSILHPFLAGLVLAAVFSIKQHCFCNSTTTR